MTQALWEILILRRAHKELQKIPSSEFDRVVESIRALAREPRPSGCKKLRNREGWRIRVGNFRVIYEIEDGVRRVTILHVGDRRDVCR